MTGGDALAAGFQNLVRTEARDLPCGHQSEQHAGNDRYRDSEQQDAGIEADVWKIEGLDQEADCRKIASTMSRCSVLIEDLPSVGGGWAALPGGPADVEPVPKSLPGGGPLPGLPPAR